MSIFQISNYGIDVRAFIFGIAITTLAQVLTWFQMNSQFVWSWWKDKPLLSVLLFAIPSGLLFWYGSRFLYETFGSVWSSRFVAFGASYITFPLLTAFFLHESVFNIKTLVCILLSFVIMWIQMRF